MKYIGYIYEFNINVSSMNSEQCKLCVISFRNIDIRLLGKVTICCNCTQELDNI